ncbi:hypothetical protein [Microtetraspora sp. NBRC 16547]|nr:hypothetical protein [Microtetraspora sp. NBRC 16547]
MSANLQVMMLLVTSLARATGKTPSEVTQKVALAIEAALPEEGT